MAKKNIKSALYLLIKIITMQLTSIVYFLFLFCHDTYEQGCKPRIVAKEKMVCVCTSTYCDDLPPIEKVPATAYTLYTSSLLGKRFEKQIKSFQSPFMNINSKNTITIDPTKSYQTIIGWGGAITDAAAINIMSLSKETRQKLMESYFLINGIEYNLCRIPMGGSDFSTRAYSYDDGKEDVELKNFALTDEDLLYKIPLIKLAKEMRNDDLQLFASTWTAPKWIKTNGEYTGGRIKYNMYQVWAEYFLKFFEAYKSYGVEFWGVTTGNEPTAALFPFVGINSIFWTPNEVSSWIRNNLGPTLRNSEFSDIKIMIVDDQTFLLPWEAQWILFDKETKRYVDGIAFHWYWNFISGYKPLSLTNYFYPDKFILSTEACTGARPGSQHVILGDWQRGEDYAHDIIQDLQHWVTGWVDWNIALDPQGGPNYIKNFVDSPIIVNKTADEFYKQPMYYALGHFSKFAPKGSIRLNTIGLAFGIEMVALRRPDDGITVVLLNRNSYDVQVIIKDQRRGIANEKISSHSIVTLVYW